MSDLQMGLLAIGVVVVAGVWLFNALQERRLRSRLEQAFDAEREDVLLRGGAPAPAPAGKRADAPAEPPVSRVEPVLGRPDVAEVAETRAEPPTSFPDVPDFDSEFDFVMAVDAPGPIGDGVLGEWMAHVAACGKPSRGYGWDAVGSRWQEIAPAGGRHAHARVTIQLADRAGAVTAAQLATVCDATRNCAERCGGTATIPDTEAALRIANDLDAFCAEVDVAIGINVVAPQGQSFAGHRIRAAAEEAGFRLAPQGIFQYRDDHDNLLFTLDNHEHAPFIPEQVGALSTRGITLLLDVPRGFGGEHAFDRMCDIGKALAQALGGSLVDDNRVVLKDASLAVIKQQLRGILATMTGRGIEAGSARALRLFA